MRIIQNKDTSTFILKRIGHDDVTLTSADFWQICREGARIDTEEEVRLFLADYEDSEGKTYTDLDQTAIDEIVEDVIETRTSNETGDQVFDSINFTIHHLN